MADICGDRVIAGDYFNVYRDLGIFYFLALQGRLGRVKGYYCDISRAPFITALSLLRKGTVDKDGNGIADEDENEQEAENNGNKKNHFR